MAVTFHTLSPGDADWLIRQHVASYASSDGFDASFGQAVAQVLANFEAGHDPVCERAFVAWSGDQRLGSVFCTREDAQTARLRLFLLVPQARGMGLGRQMLGTCMRWAQACGYTRMVLWTHESHKAACALYARMGWHCTLSRPIRNYGADLVEQRWEVTLQAPEDPPSGL